MNGAAAGRAVRALSVAALLAAALVGCDGAFRFDPGHDAPGVDASDGMTAAPNVTCAAGSSCTLVAGTNSVATCQDATCKITLSEHATAVCQQGAQCMIVCTDDDCNITCSADSRCTAQCPGAPTPVTVTGTSGCNL